jgi:hypothetical protein
MIIHIRLHTTDLRSRHRKLLALFTGILQRIPRPTGSPQLLESRKLGLGRPDEYCSVDRGGTAKNFALDVGVNSVVGSCLRYGWEYPVDLGAVRELAVTEIRDVCAFGRWLNQI